MSNPYAGSQPGWHPSRSPHRHALSPRQTGQACPGRRKQPPQRRRQREPPHSQETSSSLRVPSQPLRRGPRGDTWLRGRLRRRLKNHPFAISWIDIFFWLLRSGFKDCLSRLSRMAEDQTWLEQDKEVPGQKYVCLSFLSPEKVLANKDVFFFNRFLTNYEVEYKVSASEKFLMDQVQAVTKAVTKVEDLVANSGYEEAKATVAPVADLSGAPVADLSGSDLSGANLPVKEDPVKAAKQWRDDALKILQEVRASLSKNAADDLAVYVKANMRDFKETGIQEAYENFMFKNRKKLEEEFFNKNEFRTSIRGLKVRGVYDTAAEAGARAKTLQKIDPYFNVYVGQVGFWLPWDPEPSEVADQEYAEDQLNTLMKNYKQNESQKEQLYEEQKRERMAGSKVAVPKFGPGSKDENVLPSDMFGGSGEADLAIARKKEMASKVTLNV